MLTSKIRLEKRKYFGNECEVSRDNIKERAKLLNLVQEKNVMSKTPPQMHENKFIKCFSEIV